MQLWTLVSETYGRFGAGLHKFLDLIANHAESKGSLPLDLTRKEYRRRMTQQLSFTIQRGNARAAMAHLNECKVIYSKSSPKRGSRASGSSSRMHVQS